MTDSELQNQRMYQLRRELGLCVKCGEYVHNPEQYIMCESCRDKLHNRRSYSSKAEWRRDYMREYRVKEKAMMEQIALALQKITAVEELQTDRQEIPPDHKCWNCEWSKFHGDRFFCPLVGCVKTRRTNED